MSLSFVSSAVLSSSDGVSHNEEKPIESKEVTALRSQSGHGAARPLFDQLQYNREKEQEQYDEMTKAMRGTRTLDEEDCAHLDSIEAMRAQRESRVQQSIEDELAGFRAARADRSLVGGVYEDDEQVGEITKVDGRNNATQNDHEETKKEKQAVSVLPVIVRKKRRRATAGSGVSSGSRSDSDYQLSDAKCDTDRKGDKKSREGNYETYGKEGLVTTEKKGDRDDDETGTGGGLGGLLGCYGSDSESE